MAYCTSANIAAELKNMPISTTSNVTSASVLEFIEQADAIIDMYIGQRYATPVATAQAVNILKKISIDIVVYRIAKILDLSKSNPVPDGVIIQDITEGSAYRESMNMLKAIRDNVMALPSATLIDAASGLLSFHSESANSDIIPVFKKESQQW